MKHTKLVRLPYTGYSKQLQLLNWYLRNQPYSARLYYAAYYEDMQ